MRNNIFFRGDIIDAREEIINTKVSAWIWYIIGIESRGCSKFYDWNKAPLKYLNLNWSLPLLVKYLQCSTNPIAYWKILFFFFSLFNLKITSIFQIKSTQKRTFILWLSSSNSYTNLWENFTKITKFPNFNSKVTNFPS